MERLYIANQGEIPEIDEIRWLVNAIGLKNPIAVSGDPGNGKSSAIRFAAHVAGIPVFVRNCQTHEQTFDYLGRPILEDGKTSYALTQFTSALKKGGLLINEESGEMPSEIQKYLSTLLSDDWLDFVVLDEKGNERTLIYMRDNENWNVDGFIYSETFNPPASNTGRDNFEFSHKSRMNSFNFRDIDSLLALYIAFGTIGESFSLPLIERGVLFDHGRAIFTESSDGVWHTVYGDMLDDSQLMRQNTYMFFDRRSVEDNTVREKLFSEIKAKNPFYYDLMLFLTGVRGLVNPDVFEYDSLGERSARMIPERDKNETLVIVYPDQRMVTQGVLAFHSYAEQFGEKVARLGATYDVMNKILHGALAKRELNNGTSQANFLRVIASEVDLMPRQEDAGFVFENPAKEVPGGVGHGKGVSFDEYGEF